MKLKFESMNKKTVYDMCVGQEIGKSKLNYINFFFYWFIKDLLLLNRIIIPKNHLFFFFFVISSSVQIKVENIM